MATVKPFLHKSPNKQKLYPIAIRVTQGDDSFYIYIGNRIPLDAWDAKQGAVNIKYKSFKSPIPGEQESFKRINAKIKTEFLKVYNIVLALESNGMVPTIQEIKNAITPPARPVTTNSFFAFAEDYFATMLRGGNYNRTVAEKPAVSHFKRFLKGKDIEFKDITLKTIEEFKANLKTLKYQDKPISERTIINQLIVIRTLYNRAIKNRLVDPALSPFRQGALRLKRPQSEKIGLGIEQIKQLEEVRLEDPYSHHARNVFLFSFYTAGVYSSEADPPFRHIDPSIQKYYQLFIPAY